MSAFRYTSAKKIITIFFIMAGFCSFNNEARAATTEQKYPTLGTTVSESPWSDNSWNTPTNIYSDNDATANVIAPTYDSLDQTFVLKATGFDFSAIPDGSTINGVMLRINAFYRARQGSGSVDLCQLLDMSRAKVGTNKCSSPVALNTTVSTIITEGGSADTWGNALTTAWVKDPDFGIALGVLATAQNADVDVDYVTLEIFFTVPPAATVSASPTVCTILSGASTCNIPFTWNITDAISPNLYNLTTANTFSVSASGTGVSYPITKGTNVVEARDGTTVLASISVTGNCDTGTVWNGSVCALSPITTLGDGVSPANRAVAPGSGIVDLDYFTLQTNTGSDTVTSVTVTFAPTEAFNNIAQVDLTDTSNVTRCTSVNNPESNSILFTTCTSNGGMPVSTSETTYKVRITPKTHANMSAVTGASYDTTGTVTSFASTNTQSGTDASSATITIDNLSPADASSVSGSAGSSQVTLNWTNPVDSDYAAQIVLHRAASAVADVPGEGVTYSVGNTIGTAIVACIIITPTTTCTDTGLVNGTSYHYKIFSKDSNGNYGTGVIPAESPFTPSATTFNITSSAGPNGSIVPSGITSVAQGSSQLYTLAPDSGYKIETLIVDSISIATSTTYTFTNVQAPHTISGTFSLLPVSYTIVATAGGGGTITPLDTTNVSEGASQTYTITPSSGYEVNSLTIDGISIATSTSYTFTNIQTSHTINATFIALATGTVAGAPSTGASRPTTVTFLGKAFPKGTIQIIDKTLHNEKLSDQKNIVDADGSFRISFVGIFQTLHSFGLIVKDTLERSSQTKFFTIDTRSDDFVIKDILIPPTIDLVQGQVSRGSNALIVGYASPEHIVQIKLDDIIQNKIIAKKDGSYSFKLPTGELAFGQHKVQVIQIDPVSEKKSDPSLSRTFIVSRLSVVQADLSGDGKIDIRDWSIFLSRWISKNSLLRESIDLNGDGKTDIADFSIFIKTIRK